MTRFGVSESPLKYHFDQPLEGRHILRVDTLAVLKQVWGENILMSRDPVYSLVSCNVDDDTYRNILTSYYYRFAAFANYVDEKYLFAGDDTPLITRLIKPVRELIDDYTIAVTKRVQERNGSLLLRSHDYLYFEFKTAKYPVVDEGKIIC